MPTNEQLDKLIHEKVMGQPVDVPCDGYAKGGIVRDYRDALNKNSILGIWNCSFCGYMGSGPTQPHNIPDEIPAYSTSLDAAWKAVRKLYEKASNPKATDDEITMVDVFMFELTQSEFHPFRLNFFNLVGLTPLKLCLAALKAYGVEIESDHAN